MRHWVLAATSFAALYTSVSGCAFDTGADVGGDVGVAEEPIIGGAASSAAEDAVVLLEIGGEARCTGTLIAPRLVLTARHCVSYTDEGVECSPSGGAVAGGAIDGDRDPSEIDVYAGRRRSRLELVATGQRIYHDGARNLCNHDVALVLLDRPVTDIEPQAVRLDDTTVAGETITAVGWGVTTTSTFPTTRRHRKGVRILDVGPSRWTAPHVFLVGESICSGDSGGPALSARGAVVGTASAGGNGTEPTDDPADGCTGSYARNEYTRLAPFATLVRRAFRAARASPRLEP